MTIAQLDPSIQELISRPGVSAPATPAPPAITLSTEQGAVVDAVSSGRDVVVDATVGSGKTSTIQAMCTLLGSELRWCCA